jgi:hypothetical protein
MNATPCLNSLYRKIAGVDVRTFFNPHGIHCRTNYHARNVPGKNKHKIVTSKPDSYNLTILHRQHTGKLAHDF